VSGPNELLTAALGYAKRGWYVFPLHTPIAGGCSCQSGKDCKCIGKHPRTRNGLHDATTDEAQIRKWWSQWPEANIGIRTGSVSGLLVVDIDNKNGKQGGENLAAIAAPFGGLPVTLTATTGSGIHLFFKHPEVAVRGSASKLAEGVDVRANGGYVVAPPSLHANGKRYEWL
jgi:putative DNA primase/helicase